MKIARASLCLLIVLTLGGCPPPSQWRDLTGQNRSESVANNDAQFCYAANNAKEKPSQESAAQIWGHIKGCMAAKGWAPIRDSDWGLSN